jgi:hypothetical protein
MTKLIVAFRNFANSLKSSFAVCRRIFPHVVFYFEFVLLYNQSTEWSIFSGLSYCLKVLFILNHSFPEIQNAEVENCIFTMKREEKTWSKIAKINAC